MLQYGVLILDTQQQGDNGGGGGVLGGCGCCLHNSIGFMCYLIKVCFSRSYQCLLLYTIPV